MNSLTKNQKIAVTIAVVAIVAIVFFGNVIISLFRPAGTGSQLDTSEFMENEQGQAQVAENGTAVTVHYVGTLENGTKFDSSYDRGQPITFILGAGQVIPGWEREILGMRVGEKKRFAVPPELGYGDQQVGPIPPNSTLIFEVEIVAVQKI